jgi:hypothetical protein
MSSNKAELVQQGWKIGSVEQQGHGHGNGDLA